eukprot:GGOE01054666.1.p1 GENE.GGOE01054666.1~~GGOE01054666.1.p1  ORF type:complete len:161 (+),score=35.42 GGOE01054666.1:163-645(+)
MASRRQRTCSRCSWSTRRRWTSARPFARQKKKWMENPNPMTLFPFAALLVKSQNKEDVQQGIRLLEDVRSKPDANADILFECGYCMALGQFKVGQYEAAQRTVESLLEVRPTHQQARALQQLITQQQRREGLLGIGIAAGVAVAAVGAAVLLKGMAGRKG